MRAKLRYDSRAKDYVRDSTLTKAVAIGLIGGLVGTIIMDLFGVGLILAMGAPASISFAIIGDATAGFFSMLGIALAGGTPLGAVVHYLIGPVFGAIFGVAVSRIDAIRVDSLKKGVGLGILYVEVMSLPLLGAAAIILKMTASMTAQWFGISFVMHLVYGIALGLIICYGLGSTTSRPLHYRAEQDD
ncbi:MAG: hypothetical protein WCI67_23420 [Chloroflexales bacterium]